MSNTLKLTPEHQAERQRLAKYHSAPPSVSSTAIRSKCSQCDTPNIAWVTTEAYLSVLADEDAPQHVLDYPEGEGWICLECEETGYIEIDSSILTDTGEPFEDAAKGVHAFNHLMLISKLPDSVLSGFEKEVLDYILTSVNVAGRHDEYDLFFELVEEYSERDFELAGVAIARELKVHAEDSVVLRNMILLSLLAAPIVNAFAPETTPSLQMPLIVKKLGQTLTEYWETDEFHLVDDQRANFARGLLMRRLCNPEFVSSRGYQEDLYTQWIGENFSILAERVDEVKQNANFDYDAMAEWLGKKAGYDWIVGTAEGIGSLTTSIELGYAIEAMELKKGKKVDGFTVCDREPIYKGHYVLTLGQSAYLEQYELLHGYGGNKPPMPVYRFVEALGLKGMDEGGDGLAEEVVLALTSIAPSELELLVDAAAALNEYQKLKVIEMLDRIIASIDVQETRSEKFLEVLRDAVNPVALVEAV